MAFWKDLDRNERNDLMKKFNDYDEENEKSEPLSFCEFCNLLAYNGLTHVKGYFHYTTWGRLANVLRKVEVAPGDKRILFRLSSTSDMNDAAESVADAYVLSFSYGEEEEVAMWTNYGVPKPEAIRIRFPKAAIAKWVKENNKEKIVVYKLTNGSRCERLVDGEVKYVRFTDVAYFGRNTARDSEKTSDGVLYKGVNRPLKDVNWRKNVSRTCKDAALAFKKRGWSYEHEVRLIIRLKKPLPSKVKIAVDFTSLFNAVLNEPEKCLMLGPWYDPQNFPLEKIDGLSPEKVIKSCFKGELRMRSNCDDCSVAKKDCNCRYCTK